MWLPQPWVHCMVPLPLCMVLVVMDIMEVVRDMSIELDEVALIASEPDSIEVVPAAAVDAIEVIVVVVPTGAVLAPLTAEMPQSMVAP